MLAMDRAVNIRASIFLAAFHAPVTLDSSSIGTDADAMVCFQRLGSLFMLCSLNRVDVIIE
jgi:hypothetical protein